MRKGRLVIPAIGARIISFFRDNVPIFMRLTGSHRQDR
jgi:hypothetical protein